MSALLVEFEVRGTPTPQGSKQFMGHAKSGRAIIMNQGDVRLRPWREAIRATAEDVADCGNSYDFPLRVEMVFTFARPRSHYRTGANSHLLKADAPIHPQGPPDLSKLARGAEDAITDAGIWRDDARVVLYTKLAKVFCNEDPDALAVPGIRVRVYRAERSSTLPGTS